MPDNLDDATEGELGAIWLGTLRVLVDQYCALDDERRRLEAEAEDIKLRRDAAAKAMLGLMQSNGASSHEFDDGIEVVVGEQLRINIPEESRAEFNKWLQDNGYWGMARIHSKQETALLDARFKGKQPVPTYVQMAKVPTVSLRGRKKGA